MYTQGINLSDLTAIYFSHHDHTVVEAVRNTYLPDNMDLDRDDLQIDLTAAPVQPQSQLMGKGTTRSGILKDGYFL